MPPKRTAERKPCIVLLTKTVFGENITMPSPSIGIVEAEPKRKYAGKCLYFETYFVCQKLGRNKQRIGTMKSIGWCFTTASK